MQVKNKEWEIFFLQKTYLVSEKEFIKVLLKMFKMFLLSISLI